MCKNIDSTNDKPGDFVTSIVEAYSERKNDRNALYTLIEQFVQQDHIKSIKHHQLRNLLDLVISVKQSCTISEINSLEETRGRLAIIRPRVAYMAARAETYLDNKKEKHSKLKELRDIIDKILTATNNFRDNELIDDVDDLYDFVAAIVAYHKFYSDK